MTGDGTVTYTITYDPYDRLNIMREENSKDSPLLPFKSARKLQYKDHRKKEE